jgi:hypothetical protein
MLNGKLKDSFNLILQIGFFTSQSRITSSTMESFRLGKNWLVATLGVPDRGRSNKMGCGAGNYLVRTTAG